MHKGKQIGIEGRLKQDRWEKDGRTNTRVYIIADNIQLLADNEKSAARTAPAEDQDGDGFPEDYPF